MEKFTVHTTSETLAQRKTVLVSCIVLLLSRPSQYSIDAKVNLLRFIDSEGQNIENHSTENRKHPDKQPNIDSS